jgi:hypothetical protein
LFRNVDSLEAFRKTLDTHEKVKSSDKMKWNQDTGWFLREHWADKFTWCLPNLMLKIMLNNSMLKLTRLFLWKKQL